MYRFIWVIEMTFRNFKVVLSHKRQVEDRAPRGGREKAGDKKYAEYLFSILHTLPQFIHNLLVIFNIAKLQ